MTEPTRAVFLSYSSQYADAAEHICEALRAAELEVWFDQSELRGGDVWGHKIRKQIHDCALCIPNTSAHTQARNDGSLSAVKVDPLLASLRSDPRYAALLKKMNLLTLSKGGIV